MKTTDGGVTWKEISPDLTVKAAASSPAPKSDEAGHIPSKDDIENTGFFAEDDDQAADANRGFIQAIAPSPLDANLIWVGTSTGLIHITHDGATWTNVSPTGLPEHSTVNEIDPSPHDPNMAFAAVSVRRDLHPYFFRTRDGGKTWDKIVTGLPEAGIANVIREDPVRKGLLFAGTQTGVYFSFDFGDHWQPLQLTLPTSPVRDLAVHGDDLVAATFGRGLWILDDISPLRQFAGDLQKSPVRFFMPQTATRVHWDNHPDTPLQPETLPPRKILRTALSSTTSSIHLPRAKSLWTFWTKRELACAISPTLPRTNPFLRRTFRNIGFPRPTVCPRRGD